MKIYILHRKQVNPKKSKKSNVLLKITKCDIQNNDLSYTVRKTLKIFNYNQRRTEDF